LRVTAQGLPAPSPSNVCGQPNIRAAAKISEKTMAKTKKKKTSSKNKSRQINFYRQLKRIGAGLGILILVVLVSAAAVRLLISPAPVDKPVTAQRETSKSVSHPQKRAHHRSTSQPPTYEIYPKEDVHPQKPAPKPVPLPPPSSELPKAALIIDDMGHDRAIAEKIMALDVPITVSILPFSPFKKHVVRLAKARHIEIMLHLPMEPEEYPRIDPGPGALLTTMTPDELIVQLNKDLDAVQGIKGVNNHMGSKMTGVSTRMYQIFSILKKRNLFFIDSRTTPRTLCKPSARLLQIPFSERDVFLDHRQDAAFIQKQIDRLIRIAQKKGHAVAIGHPYPVTYRVLRRNLPNLKKHVTIVPASELTRIIR